MAPDVAEAIAQLGRRERWTGDDDCSANTRFGWGAVLLASHQMRYERPSGACVGREECMGCRFSAASTRKPSRQVGYAGLQSRSDFALALSAPCIPSANSTATAPATMRASQCGTRKGAGAPIASANFGSQACIGAGPSSTML